MRSLPPRDYELLPPLESPAGYICVIRDVDSDRYRIDSATDLQGFITAVLREMGGDFGIELVSILETEDIAASEAALYEAHHAELSREWLALDSYQLQELRQSTLRIDDHPSHYLVAQRIPPSEPQVKTIPRDREVVSFPRRRFDECRRLSRRMKPGPAVYKQYGPRSLSQYHRREMAHSQQQANEPVSWKQKLLDGIDSMLLNYPKLVAGFVLFVLLLLLLYLVQNPYVYWSPRW